MRNIKRILKENDLGDMGIGAMIVFIAMVLVAGIAASVLIQTANRLEIQAMTTGQETTREVASGLQVVDIEGLNTGGQIVSMTVTVRARAGSNDIDLSNTIIELTNGSLKTVLTYRTTARQFNHSYDKNGSIFNTGPWNMTNEEFGILVLQDEDGSLTATNPVLNRGDLVMLCIKTSACFTHAPAGLAPRDNVWGMISLEEGAPGIFSFRVPSSLTELVYDLY
jgi:flagellin FlaB